MKDLWLNKYDKVAGKTPGSILEKQAARLGEKTKHQVEPVVEQSRVLLEEENSLWHRLLLTIPTRPMYQYGHFTMLHSADFYPVFFLVDEEMMRELQPGRIGRHSLLRVESEEELQPVLQGIFNSKETERVVGLLQAQNGNGSQGVKK
ncbi:MAG: hypothetical protein ACPGWR_18280 [Ardenticatenaceae bacterium]